MKIVHVIHCCSSGGAEILAKNIIKNIKDIDNTFNIELWSIYKAEVLFNGDTKSIEYEKKFIEELELYGINVRFINKKPGFWSRLRIIPDIQRLYNKFKPDIIHCHLESVTCHIVNSLLLKKVIIIETVHNTVINKVKIHKYYLNKRIHKFVSISEKVSRNIEDILNVKKENIELIYNGIDQSKFRDKNIFSDNVKKILAVGRLTKQKDHITLIKAFEIVKEKCIKEGIDIPILEIAGEGELKPDLLKYVKERNLKEVRFLGVVNDVENLFKNHQIYVMSSIYEGLSLSLIEASISGISVICTDVGSNNEIIINNVNGLLTSDKNCEELADKIYLLIKRPDIRKKLYQNSKNFNNKFNIVDCAQSHIEMYKSIV